MGILIYPPIFVSNKFIWSSHHFYLRRTSISHTYHATLNKGTRKRLCQSNLYTFRYKMPINVFLTHLIILIILLTQDKNVIVELLTMLIICRKIRNS